ncbi:MAG: 3-deoxy-D-manno-octulosonic acid transferase [Candidatus Omnitrophica bacterium]|nr:3-deoxy-D-manno-octulosonic acid transferase [Candidatus Omnitrophota bacterium]
MFLIYDAILILVAVFYFPYYFLKKKSLREILRRFKREILSNAYLLNSPIWIHAVSVGEVGAVRVLIKKLRECYPQKKIVLTTVTSAGRKIAEAILPKEDIYYLPLDLSFLIRSFVRKINPSLFIIVETELWPNLLLSVKKKRVPLVLVNARISSFSLRGYKLIKWLLINLLDYIDLFLVQTDVDKERFLRLGVNPEKIKISGNMKFDILDDYKLEKDNFILKKLGVNLGEKLLVAGSTHPGEEELILRVFKRLKEKFPFLRLLIAPRHPERAVKIANLVKKEGLRAEFISTIERAPSRKDSIFILDILGRLLDFYGIADIVFVGGSFVKKGGHNILEPALFKKPIIFGPYMFNFQDISEQFLKENAALVVRNQEEFYKIVEEIINEPQRGIIMGERAYHLIHRNKGATQKSLEWINSIFSGI